MLKLTGIQYSVLNIWTGKRVDVYISAVGFRRMANIMTGRSATIH